MGILSSIGKAVGGIIPAIGGAIGGIPGAIVGGLVDTGVSWLGNKLIGEPNSARAFGQSQEAYEQQYANYKRRYQDTMADMTKAGLNPILAAGSGGFNVGQSPSFTSVGNMPNYQPMLGSSAYQSYMQGQKAGEESKTERQKQLNMLAQTKKLVAETANERLRSGVITEQERHLVAQITESLARTGKMFHEVTKIGAETEASRALKHKLVEQLRILEQQFKQIKKVSNAYRGAYGTGLGYIKATLGAIGALLGPGANLIK